MIPISSSPLPDSVAWSWPLAWALWAICLVLAWRGGGEDRKRRGFGAVLFILALFGCLLAFRWPILGYPLELYPDESQMISGAVMLRSDPVYWRAVDGFTSGPLNHYALVVPTLLGGSHPFFAIRLFGVLLITLVLACSYGATRAIFSERVARLSVLPLLSFFAFATDPAHVHLSSEHVPIALVALGTLAVVRYGVGRGWGWLLAAGIFLTLVPLAKPQSAPIAVVLLGVAAVLVWRNERAQRRRDGAALVGGVVFVTLGFVAYATAFDLWRDIWVSYVKGNLSLARDARSPGLRLAVRLGIQTFVCGGSVWLLASVVLADVLSWPIARRLKVVPTWYGVLVGVNCLVAFGAILYATLGYPKYFLLLTPSLGLLAGCAIARLSAGKMKGLGRAVWLLGWTMFLAAGVGLPALQRAVAFRHSGHYPAYRPEREDAADLVAAELRHWVKPGDFLAVWAAMPEFYVRTGCRQATRDGETSRQSVKTPEQAYYRARYLQDIARSNPRAFLDGSGANRRGFELNGFPDLERYLQQHYRLEKEIAGFKIYVRNDLAAPAPRPTRGDAG